MRFCRQQQQAQARHRPQSEPSPSSCSLCLRLCPGPVRLIFKLPRLISRVNLCALYCIFASTFTRPGQRRSLVWSSVPAWLQYLTHFPSAFSGTSPISAEQQGSFNLSPALSSAWASLPPPFLLPFPPLAHAPCYVFYLEQLPDEMPGLLLSRSRPGCPATNTTRCERSIDGAVR